jgi:hypothetical protein
LYTEDIEKIFLQEIREKKRTGTGSFHKRGKGVKHGMNGALKTPYHYLKEKERKKLSGEVETYNMNVILSKEEFLQKDTETQKMLLTHWRETFSNEEIKKTMRISNKPYFDLVQALDIPKKARGGNVRAKTKPKKETVSKTTSKTEIVATTFFHGLTLDYQGEFTSEELNKILTKLQLITEGEKNTFEVSISFKEKINR